MLKAKKILDKFYEYFYLGSIFLTAYISILSLLRHNYVSFKYSVLAFVVVYLLDKYKRYRDINRRINRLIEENRNYFNDLQNRIDELEEEVPIEYNMRQMREMYSKQIEKNNR